MTHIDSQNPDLSQRSYGTHVRAVLTLGLPLAGSQLAQFAVHMTDVIMMGWYGLDELAALVVALAGLAAALVVAGGVDNGALRWSATCLTRLVCLQTAKAAAPVVAAAAEELRLTSGGTASLATCRQAGRPTVNPT